MKLFKTNNMDIRQCKQLFNFELPSVTVASIELLSLGQYSM